VPDIDPLAGLDLHLLTALADAVVPADDHQSASQAGGLTFLRRDPVSSVTDPLGRVWNHDNVRVADGGGQRLRRPARTP
jgi:choline dehydrogenase-like flavoprotein